MGDSGLCRSTNACRWVLVVAAIPLILTGQICANSWPNRIDILTASEDGKIFALVTDQITWNSDVWTWTHDLSSRKRLWPLKRRDYVRDLHVSRDGKILVCETYSEIIAYDTSTHQEMWRVIPYISPDSCAYKTHFVLDDQYLLSVEGGMYTVLEIKLLDAHTGKLVDQTDESIRNFSAFATKQVYFAKDRVTIEYPNKTLIAFEAQNGKIVEVGDPTIPVTSDDKLREQVRYKGKVIEHRAKRRRAKLPGQKYVQLATANVGNAKANSIPTYEETATSLRVSDNTTSIVLHSDKLGLSNTTKTWWKLAVAIAAAAWVVLLVLDGASSKSQIRLVVDVGVICVLFALMTIAGLSELVPRSMVKYQFAPSLGYLAAIILVCIFVFAASLDRPLLRWASLLLGACMPILLPVVIAGVVLQYLGLKTSFSMTSDRHAFDRTRLRFGVSDLLWLMVFLALYMGIGAMMPIEYLLSGLLFAAALLLSLIFGTQRPVAVFLVALSTIALVMNGFVSTQFVVDSVAWGALLATILFTSVLQCHQGAWFLPQDTEAVREKPNGVGFHPSVD